MDPSSSDRGAVVEGVEVLEIGSRLELFVDHYLIDRLNDTQLKLHTPVPREVAMVFDAPWEGYSGAYVTVMKDGDVYRMYYRGNTGGEGGVGENTCYAESKDGITWTRPSLGICDYNGSQDNNIIWKGKKTEQYRNPSHNFTPFKDANPDARPDERYKALAAGPLIAFVSPDGIHWKKMREEPVITDGAFDSQNLAYWDAYRGHYVAFYRDFRDVEGNVQRWHGVRSVKRATSSDFVNWTAGQWFDFGDTPLEHLYTNATVSYFRAPHIYLAFPRRFVPDRTKYEEHPYPGVSDAILMSSRDGLHWNRTFMEAFVRRGLDPKNWTDRDGTPSWGVVPTGPEEVSLYIAEHLRYPTHRLRRFTVRTDGFVSVNAGYDGGEMVTKLLTFKGRELVINYATSAVGSVKVEVQDAEGNPVAGHTLKKSEEIFGDEIEHAVGWTGGGDLGHLAGQAVRLRFVMKDADLYSIRFR